MRKNRIYQSSTFSLSLKEFDKNTRLDMTLHVPLINTRQLPHTYSFLKKTFPEVLKTECFNDLNLPFKKEVHATEVGHLFEHILLMQICMRKTADGVKNVVVNGKTEWNWIKDPEGVFHIILDCGKNDFDYFVDSLEATIKIFEKLVAPTASLPEFNLSIPQNYGQTTLSAHP